MATNERPLLRFGVDDLKLKHPFSWIVEGGRRTGKTQFVKNVILARDRIITPSIENIIWFYASAQEEVFREIRESMGEHRVEYVKGLPEGEIDETYLQSRYGTKLVVIDDQMSEANKRQDVNDLFTRGRHENTSVILLVQNFHNSGKFMRENSLNATGSKPFSYLFLDYRADTPDALRLRNDILAPYPRFFVELYK